MDHCAGRPAMKKLMADDGPLQLSLFDQLDLAEMTGRGRRRPGGPGGRVAVGGLADLGAAAVPVSDYGGGAVGADGGEQDPLPAGLRDLVVASERPSTSRLGCAAALHGGSPGDCPRVALPAGDGATEAVAKIPDRQRAICRARDAAVDPGVRIEKLNKSHCGKKLATITISEEQE